MRTVSDFIPILTKKNSCYTFFKALVYTTYNKSNSPLLAPSPYSTKVNSLSCTRPSPRPSPSISFFAFLKIPRYTFTNCNFSIVYAFFVHRTSNKITRLKRCQVRMKRGTQTTYVYVHTSAEQGERWRKYKNRDTEKGQMPQSQGGRVPHDQKESKEKRRAAPPKCAVCMCHREETVADTRYHQSTKLPRKLKLSFPFYER